MGGKTTSSTSSYAPNDQAQGIYSDIYSRAKGVAATPYQPYGGQLVAPLSGTQQSGIQNVNNAQGVANPYLAQAAQYGQTGAAPVANIGESDIAKYMNPYQQSVINSTLANIGENNAQQQQQVLGNAAQRGALGGDRVGVAQAELARQQALSTNQTLAGLNSQNYSQALQTAQGQQQNQQTNANRAAQAAYTFGNLGTTAQNTALQGAGAQLTAGGLEQQNQQQQLSADYQQFLQQQAFPYQQTSWLAGIGTPIASGYGGTQTQTTPGPNPWSQAVGAGLGVAGLFLKDGGRIEYAEGGGTPFDFINSTPGWIPKSNPIAATRPQTAPMNMANPNTAINNSILSSLTKMKGGLKGMGGFTEQGPSYGGSLAPENFMVGPDSTGGAYADGGLVSAVHAIRKGLRNYADGGQVDTFNDRWGGFPATTGGTPFGNIGAAKAGMAQALGADPAVDAWRTNAPMQDLTPPPPIPVNPQQNPTIAAQPSIVQPQPPLSFGEIAPQGDLTQELSAQSRMPQSTASQRSGLFNLNDEQRQGLLAAGLGMLGGTSPFAGVNIGQGGLKGVEAMSQFRKEQQTKDARAEQLAIQRMGVEQRGKQLAQQAEQFAKTFGETQRQHSVQQMQPVKIGSGIYGDIYGIRDPKTGRIIPLDPKTGMPQTDIAPQSSVQPSTQTADLDETRLPPGAKPVQFIMTVNDPVAAQYNKEALSGADPTIARTAKAIAEGRRAPLPLQRNNQYNRHVMDLVQEYNPAFDATIFPSRQRTINAFKAGSEGKNVTSLNTVGQHLEELHKAAKNLDNTRYPILNKANQIIGWHTGNKDYQEKLKTYELAADAVATEAAKAFMGGGVTALTDREGWKKLFGSTDPLGAQESAIRQTVKLLDGRISALANQYNIGMSTKHEDFALLAPKTKEAFDRMRKVGEQAEKPASTAPAANAPDPLAGARAAIAKGAPRESVIKRLQDAGIDTSGL